MKKFKQLVFLACGLLLMLAANSVFAQEENAARTNKKPLEDLARSVSEKVEKENVDLTKPFLIELEGVLDRDGKLDRKKSKFTRSEGDAEMIEVGKIFVEAVNDGGVFYYLKQLGIENIKFTLGQDENQTFAVANSEMPTRQRAATVSSTMTTLVSLAKTVKNSKFSDDEKLFISSIYAESNEKVVTIKWNAEKSAVQEMIKRKLQDFRERKARQASGE